MRNYSADWGKPAVSFELRSCSITESAGSGDSVACDRVLSPWNSDYPYGDGLFNPLPEHNPFEKILYNGILYATDRAPATVEDKEKYYLNDRGQVLRVGVAGVQLGKSQIDFQRAKLRQTDIDLVIDKFE